MKLDTEALVKALGTLEGMQKKVNAQKAAILAMLPVRTGDAVFYDGNPGKVIDRSVMGPPFWMKVSVMVIIGEKGRDFDYADVDQKTLRFQFDDKAVGNYSPRDHKADWDKLTFFPRREEAVEDPLQRPDMEGC